ncbi:MAG: winged helix-turn-helix transcriptional regulator [Antricoccus sp.]
MPREPDQSQQVTALSIALDALGDRDCVATLRAVIGRNTSFTQIKAITGLSDPAQSRRLQHLCKSGLVAHEGSIYKPTESGWDSWQVLLSMWAWDYNWFGEPNHRIGQRLRHTPCANIGLPIFGCASCEAIGVSAAETSTVLYRVEHGFSLEIGDRRTRHAPLKHLDAAAIIGDGATSALLAWAFLGVGRFTDFHSIVPDLAPATISSRLRVLQRGGVLVQGSRAADPKRSYRLTTKGLDFFQIFMCVEYLARRQFSIDGMTGMTTLHLACGQRLVPRYTCNACNQPLDRATTEFLASA